MQAWLMAGLSMEQMGREAAWPGNSDSRHYAVSAILSDTLHCMVGETFDFQDGLDCWVRSCPQRMGTVLGSTRGSWQWATRCTEFRSIEKVGS